MQATLQVYIYIIYVIYVYIYVYIYYIQNRMSEAVALNADKD